MTWSDVLSFVWSELTKPRISIAGFVVTLVAIAITRAIIDAKRQAP